MSNEPTTVLAICASCPALAEGATAFDLAPLLDEHYDRTGHLKWAVSLTDGKESCAP